MALASSRAPDRAGDRHRAARLAGADRPRSSRCVEAVERRRRAPPARRPPPGPTSSAGRPGFRRLPGAGSRRQRRRLRPGRPRDRRGGSRWPSHRAVEPRPAGDRPGSRRGRCSAPRSTSSPATGDGAPCTGGSPRRPAPTTRWRPPSAWPARARAAPDAAAAARRESPRPADPGLPGRASTRRRGWASTTGPSPATPSRAAGTWTRCEPGGRAVVRRRAASGCTSATAVWPGSAGRRSTPTTTPPWARSTSSPSTPTVHGPGLGRALTLAGLRPLAAGASPSGCSTSTATTPRRTRCTSRRGCP